jgi:ATP-binding cassette, subfamily B, vacuolar membrane transporter HMT1/ACLQ
MAMPWVSNPTAQAILNYLQIAYPIILLVLYLTTFTVRSVLIARGESDAQETQPEQLGPGGKPLPRKKNNAAHKAADLTLDLDFARPRKLLFEWLSVGVILALSANILVVIVHAISARNEGWWCGQAPTVCGERATANAITY